MLVYAKGDRYRRVAWVVPSVKAQLIRPGNMAKSNCKVIASKGGTSFWVLFVSSSSSSSGRLLPVLVLYRSH